MNIVIGYDFEDVEKVIRKKGNRLREFVSDYTLFDLETTDKNIYHAKIIEIAAVKVRDNNIVDKFETLVNPQIHIPEDATHINGITDDMVANSPLISDVLPQFIDFIGDDILIGHNINAYDLNIIYDLAFDLLGMNVSNDFIDTLDLVHCLDDLELPNYEMGTLCNHFNVINSNAHRALPDVIANHECYQKMKIYNIGDYKFFKSNKVDTEFTCYTDVTDKRICLTGDFKCGSREFVKQRLTELGARVTNSISKKTNYLLVGDLGTTTTHKLTDASALGVNVIYEKDFITEDNNDIEIEQEQVNVSDNITLSDLKENLKKIITSVCSKQSVDEKYIHCREIKDGYSLWICEPIDLKETYRSFSIYLKGKKEPKYAVEITSKKVQSVQIPNGTEHEFDKLKKLTVIFPMNHSQLFDYLEKLFDCSLELFEPSTKIGCCGKFNDCSDLKKCVHENTFYARACYYRKNLDSNRIFYGKNRNV